ncbi:class I SAM-dependent rRNA methyltransferase [Paenibacillus woosongensis]|uniref:Ribosomal RNA large subunit methyltransferase I n=1 Tax=Paenibacillus woosongensis TaxID=307580 RepID=A0ABQ4MPV2_9BACL|nr:class I SAM-dependent rRNA methyltransferase [Paenibacillus woosongensis]GIP57732.1 ribosomal RNA large subunit methyltransferase I [Paenibacillus woosongensis]
MPSVILQRSRKKRLEQGHPWIYSNEIEKVEGGPQPGGLVSVLDWRGKFLATGYYNPDSQITVRVISYQPLEAMDTAFFIQRFEQCLAHRNRFLQEDAYRLVYGEADFLPGLVVDRFGDVLVVQLLTLGMDRCRDSIVEALAAVLQPAGIYERSDVSVRALEGLEEVKGPLYGDPPRHVTVTENGLLIQVDIWQGQKTGYFFDQRENRASIEPLMTGWGERSGVTLQQLPADGGGFRMAPVNRKGKEVVFPYWDGATVLECFSHTGSFTLHACKYGAKKVTCLDISEHAIQSARENVRLNGFEERVEFVVADAFEYLRSQVKGQDERRLRAADTGKVDTSQPMTAGGGRTWDVVILDPPAFAKTKGAVKGACRGYKDINLHGLKLVNEGGYLVTASCSYHMKPELFLQTIQEAAMDAGKVLRLIEWRAAGKDHPQILGVNEGHYLKFAIFEVRSKTF